MPITRRLVKGAAIDAPENDRNFDLLGGGNAPIPLTISGGAITVDGAGLYVIDPEGMASSDFLDNVFGTVESDEVELTLANAARQVIVRHATGNLRLENGTMFIMDSLNDMIKFRNRGGTVLRETARKNVPET